MPKFKMLAPAGALAVIGTAMPAVAQTVSLNNTARGVYLASVANASGSSGKAGGNIYTQGGASHSYLVFDLTGVSGQVTSASLTFDASHGISNGSPTLNLYDYTGSVSALTGGTATASTAYADLGSGILYGSYANVPTDGTAFTITLNDAALSALTSGEGQSFAFGGSVDSTGGGAFSSAVNRPPVVLSLTTITAAVPEPASWAMMILGLGAVGYAMRRRKVTTRVSYAA